MEDVKREILRAVEELFESFARDNVDYERVRWELDYIVYPSIGSYLADGSLTKEEGIEIFEFCERKLRELKLMMDSA
ncbi:hypothetical protein [Archaeoglobus veneficus]|uniref:Pyruvate carboxylase subunit B n=1 Tax=Archaeoglobus veneficus (strain DSM 11195 / SNP6) TaxID=693661 RepID=F2KQP0_ARCVS|nr:hypothetical protein [Archaeoglobus veneficus]AEA46602.1 hypothetical protein Arcve_0581 [Archaeoglobus veneficus SNP6]